MRRLERRQHGVKIVLGLREGQSAEAVVAAKLNNHNVGMEAKDGGQGGDGVLGGGAAGALVDDVGMVPLSVQLTLERIGERLARRESVAGRNAVAEADEHLRGRCKDRHGQKNQASRDDKDAPNVHSTSVDARGGWDFDGGTSD